MGVLKRRSTVQSSGRGQDERVPAWRLGTESMFLYPNEFGKVPGEEFDAAVPGVAGLALALCHLVALTILIIAALAQVLKHVVLTEALPACLLRHSDL